MKDKGKNYNEGELSRLKSILFPSKGRKTPDSLPTEDEAPKYTTCLRTDIDKLRSEISRMLTKEAVK